MEYYHAGVCSPYRPDGSQVMTENLDAKKTQEREVRQYSKGEEIANSVSHGVGAVLSVAALVLLVVEAQAHGGGTRLVAALLMGGGLVVEYTFSTLYHAIVNPEAKRRLRVLDHCGIYLLIAGSYAPYALVTLADHGGPALCAIVWIIAGAGIIAECAMRERQPKWLSAVIYVAMGWLVVFCASDLIALLPATAFALLLAGGICYTAGAVFYAFKRVPYLHFVFHLLTLAGSILMVVSVLVYVM